MYSIKEMFYSLQGEGAQTGRPAVFCRFTGCNLWNGLERDRAQSACPFCDTDFVGVDGQNGGKFKTAAELAQAIKALWPALSNTLAKPLKQRPYVVFTGGEPLLQLDEALIAAMHQAGFEVAVETNGSIEPPPGIDWLCVSPKNKMELKIRAGQELKLLYPQQDLPPEQFTQLDFDYFYLQAIDTSDSSNNAVAKNNLQATLNYVLKHPQWRLSLQTHKILNID